MGTDKDKRTAEAERVEKAAEKVEKAAEKVEKAAEHIEHSDESLVGSIYDIDRGGEGQEGGATS
jgi:hypothetical protein